MPISAEISDNQKTSVATGLPFNEMSVLAPLLFIYTAGYMALMVSDFLLRAQLDTPPGLLPIYLALLGAYAADKEIRRWVGKPEPQRRGSVFVYLWCLLYLVFFVVYFFRRDFSIPPEMSGLSLRVLGVFFGSKASKYIHEGYFFPRMHMTQDQQAAVLNLFAMKDKISRQDAIAALNVSARTANRVLEALEEQGQIRREGAGPSTVYRRT